MCAAQIACRFSRHKFVILKAVPWRLAKKVSLGSRQGLACTHESVSGRDAPAAQDDLKNARMTFTVECNRKWNHAQLAKSAPTLSATNSALYCPPQWL